IVQAMGEALRRPAFRTQDWQAEKPVLRDELAQMSQNPEAALAAILYDQAFQKHPYRRDVRGIPAGLDRVDLAAVRAFYEKYYRPANMTLVVVGNVDLESVDRAARAAFVGPPAPAPPPPLPAPERACARAVRRELPSPFRLGYIGLAFPAPAVTDQPDVYAMDLILTLLEHQGTGRLPRILRGQAGIEATYETRRQPGLLTLIAGAPGGNLESVEALMRRELETLVNRPVAAEELALARRALRGSFILDNETLAGQAGLLGYYDAIDRWQFGVEYLARVEALTPEDVQATAKKYIQLEQAVTVVLRPAAEGARPRGAVR
ncbi:MAG: insulinase family protein, partial [Armatimonadetes bacterium]|nr:insulinase family protein [Armatimonadota bacterium]